MSTPAVALSRLGSVAPSSGLFDPGQQIVLVATPDPGSTFGSWSGDTDGCSPVTGMPNAILVPMDRARRIDATFQAEV